MRLFASAAIEPILYSLDAHTINQPTEWVETYSEANKKKSKTEK